LTAPLQTLAAVLATSIANISSAYDNDPALNLNLVTEVHVTQEVNACYNAFGVLALNVQPAPSLRADGDIKSFKALSAELRNCYVASDLDPGFELNAQLAQNIIFRRLQRPFQDGKGNSESLHAAKLFLLLKDSHLIAVNRKIVCARKTGRTAADNGDGFAVIVSFFWHKAGLGIELLVGNEFFDLINSNRRIYTASRAGGLAGAGTDASADGGEWVFLLDNSRASVYLPCAASLT
jgi:hypothetical protein